MPTPIRFLVDRCAGRKLVDWLRTQGYDVADQCGPGEDPGDLAILEQAAHEGRVLITIDTDFGHLVFAQGRRHAGLIRLPDVPAAARIAMLQQLLRQHQEDLQTGAVLTIRDGRVRVTRTE